MSWGVWGQLIALSVSTSMGGRSQVETADFSEFF